MTNLIGCSHTNDEFDWLSLFGELSKSFHENRAELTLHLLVIAIDSLLLGS